MSSGVQKRLNHHAHLQLGSPGTSGASSRGGGAVPTVCRAEAAFQGIVMARDVGMRLLLSVVGDLGFQGMHPGRPVYQLSDSKRGECCGPWVQQ